MHTDVHWHQGFIVQRLLLLLLLLLALAAAGPRGLWTSHPESAASLELSVCLPVHLADRPPAPLTTTTTTTSTTLTPYLSSLTAPGTPPS